MGRASFPFGKLPIPYRSARCSASRAGLVALLLAGGCAEYRAPGLEAIPPVTGAAADRHACEGSGILYRRTELFFGLARPGGAPVTAQEFTRFLDEIVTPRFPMGSTVLEAEGRFRDRHGNLIREAARILILLYDAGDRSAPERIEAIRAAYRRAFGQESVLRADGGACVSF